MADFCEEQQCQRQREEGQREEGHAQGDADSERSCSSGLDGRDDKKKRRKESQGRMYSDDNGLKIAKACVWN